MDYFDYLIPEKLKIRLKPGHLVEIPFKKSSLFGIVDSIKNTSDFSYLKQIQELKSTLPYLSQNHLKLLRWFAEHYYYSLASALNLFCATPPKKNLPFNAPEFITNTDRLKPDINIKKLTENIIKSEQKSFFIEDNDIKKSYQLQLGLINDSLKQNKQILILFPQIWQIKNFCKFLSDKQMKKTAIVTNKLFLSKNNYYQTFKKIQSNDYQIIIGTRSAVFCDIPELDIIYINDSANEDYKNWDQTPRYQTNTVAQKKAQLEDAKLIMSGSNFSPVIFFQAQKQKSKFITLNKKHPVRIIDLNNQEPGKYSYLSEKLINSIQEQLDKQQKSLLIVNKKGFAGSIICQDCGYIPKCEKCNFPLVLSKNKLNCFQCKIEIDVPTICPKCRGTKLKPLGIGAEQVIEILKNTFPQITISENFNDQAQIYISSAQINNVKILSKINLLAFVYLDSLMYLPDFSANFKIYQMINNIRSQYQSFGPDEKQILLQTNFAQNLAVMNINIPYIEFFRAEIASRKQFNYPPFCKLIKLFFQHHDMKICRREAQLMSNKLKNLGFHPSAPYFYYHKIIRGRYRIQILLKLREKELIKFNQNINKINSHWTIDKEPISVL